MMKKPAFWQRFLRHDGGVSAIEFALLAPVLLALIIGSVTLYDAFRTSQIVAKVTSTIGDMVSRQNGPMNRATVQSIQDFMSALVPQSAAPSALRLTSVSNKAGTLIIDWTDKVGNVDLVGLDDVDLAKLPTIAVGDSIIVTETFVPFTAMITGFWVGSMTFKEILVNRPRFLTKIPFER